jgi:hypothetical protein
MCGHRFRIGLCTSTSRKSLHQSEYGNFIPPEFFFETNHEPFGLNFDQLIMISNYNDTQIKTVQGQINIKQNLVSYSVH